MRPRRTSARVSGLILSPVALLALAAAAAGPDEAPRRPPEPFRVFVHATPTADTALQATLHDALPAVRERVGRRSRWFQVVDSADTAEITLRIVHYRQGYPRDPAVGRVRLSEAMHDCWATRYHHMDAVAHAGDARESLSGLDHRCVNVGPSLRNAAGHLAEELERFAKDNYGAVSRAKVQAIAKRERGDVPR